jgi:hypothetical protein
MNIYILLKKKCFNYLRLRLGTAYIYITVLSQGIGPFATRRILNPPWLILIGYVFFFWRSRILKKQEGLRNGERRFYVIGYPLYACMAETNTRKPSQNTSWVF